MTKIIIIYIGIYNLQFHKIKINFFSIGIFLISWTPYALVSMYSAFIDSNDITPLVATLPAMFAKSSTVLSSIFYILSNKKIFEKIIADSESNQDEHPKELLSPSRGISSFFLYKFRIKKIIIFFLLKKSTRNKSRYE